MGFMDRSDILIWTRNIYNAVNERVLPQSQFQGRFLITLLRARTVNSAKHSATSIKVLEDLHSANIIETPMVTEPLVSC